MPRAAMRLLAAALGLLSLSAGAQISPGEYVAPGGRATLRITPHSGSAVRFQLNAVGANLFDYKRLF